MLSNIIIVGISSSENFLSIKSSFQQEINDIEKEDPLKNSAKFQNRSLDNLSIQNNSISLRDTTGNISLINKVNISSLPPFSPPKNIIEMPEHRIDPEGFAKAKKEAETRKPNTTVSEIFIPPLSNNSTISSNLTNKMVNPSTPSSSSLIHNGFNGLDISRGGAIPPDVQVASGTSHIVEMVNLAGQIFTKDGNSLKIFYLSDFFQTGSDRISDPKILFDGESKRWFASIFDVTTGSVVVAVSITDNPMGLWNHYNIPFGNPFGSACPDQPIIGSITDKFVVSANLFSRYCQQPFLGSQYVIVDKQDLINGIYPPRSQHSPIEGVASVHPVRSLSDTSNLYMVTVHVYFSDIVSLYSLSGSVPNAVAQVTHLPIQLTNMPPDSIQPGNVLLETNDARVVDAVWYNGNIWFTFNDACVPTGDSQTRSCIRLINIDTTANAVKQDFAIGSSNWYLFFPAIHLESSGNLNILFGHSSSTVFPSLAITNRLVSDPNNTVRPAIPLIEGSAPNNDRRYGDYFGSGLDPVYPFYNWLAGEYQGARGWQTFIANVTSMPIRISNDLEHSVNPEITASGTYVHVVWDNKKDILFSRSTDGGITFGNVINLSNNDLIHSSGNQKIAVDGNNIYVIWETRTEDNCCWSVMFSSSNDGGITFSQPIVLASNNQWENFNRSSFPQLAVAENGDIFVVWRDNSIDNEDILFKKSSNNGISFSSAENLSRSPGKSTMPYLAVSLNYVYVTWYDNTPGQYDLFFTKSIDNGESFGIVSDLGKAGFGERYVGRAQYVFAVDNKVYVTWQDCCSGIFHISFRASLDNGNTFGEIVTINSRGQGGSPWILAQLIASGNNVYIGWQDLQMVFLSISKNNGLNFDSKILVDNRGGPYISPMFAPSIGVLNDEIYTTWFDRQPNGNYRTNIKNSIDNGDSFGKIVNLASFGNVPGPLPYTDLIPKVSVSDNGNAYVVWSDNTHGNLEIFFKRIN